MAGEETRAGKDTKAKREVTKDGGEAKKETKK